MIVADSIGYSSLSTELIPRDDDIMSMFDYDGSRMPIAIVSRTPMGGFENADKLRVSI